MTVDLTTLSEAEREGIAWGAANNNLDEQEYADQLVTDGALQQLAIKREVDARQQQQLFDIALSLSVEARAQLRDSVLTLAAQEGKLPLEVAAQEDAQEPAEEAP